MLAHVSTNALDLGQYRILAELGHDAVSRVFLAEHHVLGRRAAIKVLTEEAAANPELRSRMGAAAQAHVQSAFNLRAHATALADLYDAVLTRWRGAPTPPPSRR